MCSGRVDPIFILNAFEEGLDGVLVAGCHPGDCHYLSGNYHAKYKILFTKKLLEKIGVDTARLRLEWVSAAEGRKFADVVSEFTEDIKRLGVLRENSDVKLKESLTFAKELCSDFRLRWIISRARDLVEIKNAHGEQIPEEKFEKLLDNFIDTELIKLKILHLIENQRLSAEEISQVLSIPTDKIMEYLIGMTDDHLVSFQVEDSSARFIKEGGGYK